MASRRHVGTSLSLICLLAAILAPLGCANVGVSSYSGEATELRVIDDKTGEPLAGVVGLIGWQVEAPSIFGDTPYRFVEISETVSDSGGMLRFPGWGPRLPPPGATFTNNAPAILVFKADYQPQRISNPFSNSNPAPGRLGLIESRKSIRMIRNEAPLSKYQHEVASASGFLRVLVQHRSDICNFEKFPRMLSEFMKIEERVRAEKIHSFPGIASYFVRNDIAHQNRGCASIKELLKAIGK